MTFDPTLAEVARTHHSDNAVQIFSTVSLLADPALLPSQHDDVAGYISFELSRRFGQTWIVQDVFPSVRTSTFHTDYRDAGSRLDSCFLAAAYLDPDVFLSSERDLEVLLATLLNVNRVLRRRFLLFVPLHLDGPLATRLIRWAHDVAPIPAGSLLATVDIGSSVTLEEFATQLADYVATC